MFYNGNIVNYKMPHEAMVDFLEYLCSQNIKPILIGHIIKRYDCHVLYNVLKQCNMWNEFCKNIVGFLDTLDLFKKVVPGLTCYKQSFLVEQLPGDFYECHNAIDDTKALYKLVCTKGDILNYIHILLFSPSYPHDYQLQLSNLKTFSNAIKAKAISKTIALKAARSNLRICHCSLAVKRNGFDGLYAMLSEKTSAGKERVTSNKRVIQKIFDFVK